jgi:hypothetical protein
MNKERFEARLPVLALGDADALARSEALLQEAELRASEMAKEVGRRQQDQRRAQNAVDLFHQGHCPTCEQSVPLDRWVQVRDAAKRALAEHTTEQRQADADVAGGWGDRDQAGDGSGQPAST